MNSSRVYNRIKRLARPPRIQSTRHIQPVFIIGSGRCGTTLLRRILNTSNEIYIPPETYVLGDSIREFRSARLFVDWEPLCRLIISKFMFSLDYETFPDSNLQALLERLKTTPDNERGCADLIDKLYMTWATTANPGAQRWGDKTPINVFSLNLIDGVFPGAKYVHLVRDGVDVVASMLNMGRYNSTETAAKRWKQAVLLSRDFGLSRRKRYLEVTYESLVHEPERQIESICDFSGLRYCEKMISDLSSTTKMGDVTERQHYHNVTRPIFEKSIGNGRKVLNEEQVRAALKIMGPEMRELGYRV